MATKPFNPKMCVCLLGVPNGRHHDLADAMNAMMTKLGARVFISNTDILSDAPIFGNDLIGLDVMIKVIGVPEGSSSLSMLDPRSETVKKSWSRRKKQNVVGS